jgi:hypothetical protein
MTDRDYTSEAEAEEMIESVIAEAEDSMSPAVTPFLSLGTNDPAEEILDGPTTPEQARAHDLWQAFRPH